MKYFVYKWVWDLFKSEGYDMSNFILVEKLPE